MRKKIVNLSKLNLNKENIGGLMAAESGKLLGGATQQLENTCQAQSCGATCNTLCPTRSPLQCPATYIQCPSVDICPGSLAC